MWMPGTLTQILRLAQQVLHQLSHSPASVVNFIQQTFHFCYSSFNHQNLHFFLISYKHILTHICAHIHVCMHAHTHQTLLPVGKVGLTLGISCLDLLISLIVMPSELTLHTCFIFMFPLHVFQNLQYYSILFNTFVSSCHLSFCVSSVKGFHIFLRLYISRVVLIYARLCSFTWMGAMFCWIPLKNVGLFPSRYMNCF